MSKKQVRRLESKIIDLAQRNAVLTAQQAVREEHEARQAAAAQQAAAPPPPAPAPPPPPEIREQIAELRRVNPYAAGILARLHARELLVDAERQPGRNVA